MRVVFQELLVALEFQSVQAPALPEECWVISVFSQPWDAAGPAAGKACSESTRGCRWS